MGSTNGDTAARLEEIGRWPGEPPASGNETYGYWGDVRDRDVLELGCGAVRWAVALAAAGAHPVGVDLTPSRLRQAARILHKAGARIPLVRANAERVPFRDASFDIVFCDFGALSFADPYRTVPEVARILRTNGILAFATWTPIRSLAFDARRGRIQRRLVNPYFGMHRIASPDEVEFQIPYGEWIRLFFAHDLAVESLTELPTPRRARSPYLTQAEIAWGARYPLEAIWKVRKRA